MDLLLDKNKRYVIGVSGGPDSMTLLSLCVKQQISVVVAHVNYQKRASANRDEEIVRRYCEKYNIVMRVLKPKYESGNFQAWARDVRYAFYIELCKEYDCDGILLAHQQDDVLETYLMQKERGSMVDYYGMRVYREYKGYGLYRPLLGWTRKDVLRYVDEYQIPFGMDESNLGNDYRRNQIRHEVVEVADEKQRQEWLDAISTDNLCLVAYNQLLDEYIQEVWLIEDYAKENEKVRLDGLRRYLKHHNIHEADSFRDVYLQELDKKICSGKNYQIALNTEYVLDCSYGIMRICEVAKEYVVVLDGIENRETEWFTVSSVSGPSTCAVYVTEDDFPLCIRNYRDGDWIQMRFGKKKISRWFMDRKIPLWQ